MPRFPDRSNDIIQTFKMHGAGTINKLAEHCINGGVFSDEELHHITFQGVKILVARALKHRNEQGLPIAILTQQRDGHAHVWVQLEFATFEDCRYKLARDIVACEHDHQALFPMRDHIEERFGVSLDLPKYGLLPGQDPWWKPIADESDDDKDDRGYTEEPGDEKC